MESIGLVPAMAGEIVVASAERLRYATAAYLARFKGQSRVPTESDLRGYFLWCQSRGLEPLEASRVHIELFLRWMQEVHGYQPSTVSRRLSVISGFYRTCVIDGTLQHSPAEYVRRPAVSSKSPTLGLTHLQFEAMLTAARDSTRLDDFALVAMLGLLGLRIFEATGANIDDLGEEHGHRVLTVRGKGDKIVLVPLPPAVNRALERAINGRACGPILRTRRGTRMDRHCATAGYGAGPPPPESRLPGCIPTCSGTPSSRPCSTPESTCATFKLPLATPTHAPPCATTALASRSTGTPPTSSQPSSPALRDNPWRSRAA
jgi:integrase/recombinase XerD